MDFVQLYHKLLASWRIIAYSVAICVVLALLYLLLATRIYASSALLQIQEKGGSLMGVATNNSDEAISPEVLNTVEASLLSQSLMLRVIHAANLGNDPKFAPPKSDGTPYLDSELLKLFKDKLTVGLRRATRLIDVTVEDPDPVRAQQLVQIVISQYLEQTFEAQLNGIKASNDYLSDEVQRFWGDLPRIREAVDKKDTAGLLTLASIAQDTEVAQLQTRIHEEEAYFASVKEVFMENHPRYIAAQRRLQELQEAQSAAVLRAAERVETSYDNAKAAQLELTNRIQQQEQAALPGNGNQPVVSADVLAQEVASDRALNDTILERMNQVPATQRVDENTVRVVEEPMVVPKPVRPRAALALAAAILGGIVIGMGIIIVQDFFNTTFTNVIDVEAALGVPVLAAVPKSKLIAQDADALSINTNSIEAEAFRTLRTSIHLLENKDDAVYKVKDVARNAVLFTSSNPGEGKTSCAYNYAVMLSRQGLKTLLIDGDLRRATLTALVVKSKKGPGFSEVLSGATSLQEVGRPTLHENLFFLPAGGSFGRTEERLDVNKVGEFMRREAGQYDRVVIDSPPINAVSDSLLFAPHVLMNCLVVDSGRTPKAAVARACALLKEANRGVIGVVLNNVGTNKRAAYETHGYAKDFSYTYSAE